MPSPAAVLIVAIIGILAIGAMWLMCERCWERRDRHIEPRWHDEDE